MPTNEQLSSAIEETQAQMSRVDTKSSMLLAGSLTTLSVGIAVLAKASLPPSAAAAALCAALVVAAAVACLITAARPALRGNYGFVRWAAAPTPSALMAEFSPSDREMDAYQAHRLLSLSRSVRRKYRLVRLASDLLRVALLLAVLTIILTAF